MKWLAFLSNFAVLGASALTRSLAAEDWTVTNEQGNITVPGKFPSQVHLDLYAAQVISDPYHGLNDLHLRWIAAQNWTYTSKPITELNKDKAIATWLVFDGLDTYTTIQFCNKIVATTDNQFKQWSVDVSSALAECKDDPVLSINFGSVPAIIDKLNASGIQTWPADVVYPFEYPNRQWVRKEQSDFGWDWGPAFVPTGPWRDGVIVQLSKGEAYSLNTNIDIYRKGQLNNIAADQSQPWVVNASLDYIGTLPDNISMRAVIADASDKSKVLYSGKLQHITRSNSAITGSIVIDGKRPEIWWPRGMGKQPLYSILVSVSGCGNERPSLVTERRVGFRTILLSVGNVTAEQIARGYQPGNNWHFEVNGHEFYAKGANMVPPDAFWPRVTSDRMSRMFDSIEAQNFNMLRIWSSGAYLPDFIYDLADERGVLLWSEFEFSDSLYPDYPAFTQSVADEISYNVRRINHHPSLACWAGGNEFENLLLPIAHGADPERYPYFVGQYEHLFITVMFSILAENSRSISYTPCSANNGWTEIDFSLTVPMIERYDNKTAGDLYGNTDYYNYDSSVSFDYAKYPVGRFAVEFGFTSMPSLATWKEALEPEDLHFNSSVIQLRNHHYPPGGLYTDNYANGTKGLVEMTLAVERYYPTPNKDDSVANFSSWCHATQLFQADFYKSQIQFYRRGSAMPERQLGSLYWQLNDIWQAPTWAALEYSGRWKALPYMARQVYKNIISAPYYNYTSGDLEIWVTSDLWETVSGSLSLSWIDLKGKPIADNAGMPTSIDFSVPEINSTLVFKTNIAHVGLPDRKDAILLLTLQASGHLPNDEAITQFTHDNHFLPVWPKDTKIADPGLKLSKDDATGSFVVEAAKGVSLYTWLTHPDDVLGFFDDNAFVLVPGQKKQVGFKLQGARARLGRHPRLRRQDAPKRGASPSFAPTLPAGTWEYVTFASAQDEFDATAAVVLEDAQRILTVVGDDDDDLASYRALAAARGMDILAEEAIMPSDLSALPSFPMANSKTESFFKGIETAQMGSALRCRLKVTTAASGEEDGSGSGSSRPAASGQVGVQDGMAVFDKINTEQGMRRRGLGTLVMRTLAAEAQARGATTGWLMGTPEGQLLYDRLGWKHTFRVLCLGNKDIVKNP